MLCREYCISLTVTIGNPKIIRQWEHTSKHIRVRILASSIHNVLCCEYCIFSLQGRAHTLPQLGTAVMSYSMGAVSCSGPFFTLRTKSTASTYIYSSAYTSKISSFAILFGCTRSWPRSCAEPHMKGKKWYSSSPHTPWEPAGSNLCISHMISVHSSCAIRALCYSGSCPTFFYSACKNRLQRCKHHNSSRSCIPDCAIAMHFVTNLQETHLPLKRAELCSVDDLVTLLLMLGIIRMLPRTQHLMKSHVNFSCNYREDNTGMRNVVEVQEHTSMSFARLSWGSSKPWRP
jgi:hypothetical protein